MVRYAIPRVSAFCLLSLCAAGAKADPRSIPPQEFPAAFGVNIHYTKGEPSETAMLGKAYRVARMDFHWNATERERGVYDFSAYDGLLREFEEQGVTPLFILDYGNDLYQQGPPRTPEAISAYARWAAAAAARYRGRKIMWEFWNEPNIIPFWSNPPDPEEYAALVNEAAPAMRKADPKCTLLVGATSGFPWEYIETIMRRGVLRWADAFSVHPYRSGMPETVAPDYARLRRMLYKHSPKRTIPILSGEWGYSTNTKTGIPEERQAQYLVRQRLINASQGIRTSIWYDWKNDGPDPEENEHRFGSMTQDLTPKPSYTAALVMTETLSGYRFARMLKDGPDEYVMLLRNGKGETALAMWTTGATQAYRVQGPIQRIVEMGGRRTGGSERASTVLYFGPSPRYVLMGKSAEMDAKTMWWWMKPHTVVEAGKRIQTTGITIKNTTREVRRYAVSVAVDGGTDDLTGVMGLFIEPGYQRTIPVAIRIRRRTPETRLRVFVKSWPADEPGLLWLDRSDPNDGDQRVALTDTAEIPLTVANPLTVTAGPVSGPSRSEANVTLESPLGGPENLAVMLTDTMGLKAARPVKVTSRPDQERIMVRVPVGEAEVSYAYGVRVLDESGAEVASAPPVRFHQLITPGADIPVGEPPRELSIHGEGDEKPGGSSALTVQRDPERGTVADIRATFPEGWRYFVVTPEDRAIPAGAMAVGMWVNGDACGDALRCRFIDAKGQTYQPTYGPINWKGWRWVTMRLDDPTVGSWGGPQDGRINHPIKWDSIFLLDSANRTAHTAHVQFDDVTVMTRMQ